MILYIYCASIQNICYILAISYFIMFNATDISTNIAQSTQFFLKDYFYSAHNIGLVLQLCSFLK